MDDLRVQKVKHTSLCEVLDRLLATGVAALGDVTISVADIDLIFLSLQVVVTSVDEGGRDGNRHNGEPPLDTEQCQSNEGAHDREQPPYARDASAGRRPVRPAERQEAPRRVPINRRVEAASQNTNAPNLPEKDSQNAALGLGRLVLVLMKLLHDVLERQAVRRVEKGSLGVEEMERLGHCLMKQADAIERLRVEFGLNEDDLNLDLGPLGSIFD